MSEKSTTITIEIAPDGIHVHCSYEGTLASVPAAVERLRAAGVLDLVNTHRSPTAPVHARHKPAPRVEPFYSPDGTACCPVHRTALSDGHYGPYCSAKAKPGEAANAKGYCSLRFNG